MMGRKEVRAMRTVEKALSAFTGAISEVEKANTLLLEATVEDDAKLEGINESIFKKKQEVKDLKQDLKCTHAMKLEKLAQIEMNKDLIAKLSRFTGKGK